LLKADKQLMRNLNRAPQRSENQQPASKAVPFPLQLEMRVPFEPTAFPNGARIHLLYELHLTNFVNSPLYVSRIDVIDADASTSGAGTVNQP
jgi:hypothetical protein